MTSPTNYYSQLLRLAMPVVLSQAGQVSVMLADTVMVGGLGESALASVSFSGNLILPIIYAGGVAMCITPLVGRRYGAGRSESVAFCFKQTKLFSLAVGIVQTLVAILLWALVPYMGQSAEVVSISQGYIPILIASLIPAQMFLGYKQFVEGLHNTSLAMRISVSGNILNILLNYVFIYGLGSIEPIGVNGAAWSTLIARVGMWIAMEVVLRRSKKCKPYYGLSDMIRSSRMAVKRLTLIGMPIGGQMVVECLVFALGGIMMGWVGTAAMAAHQVVMSFTCLTYMMAAGLSSAVTIKVSVSRGQNDEDSVVKYTRASIVQVIAFMSAMAVVLIMGRNVIPALIVDSAAVAEVAAQLMIIGGCFQLFDGLQVVGLGALRGMGDMRYPAIVSGVAYAATSLPVGCIIAFGMGVGATGIWYGYLIGLALASAMLLLRVRGNIRTRNYM